MSYEERLGISTCGRDIHGKDSIDDKNNSDVNNEKKNDGNSDKNDRNDVGSGGKNKKKSKASKKYMKVSLMIYDRFLLLLLELHYCY